MRARLSFLSLAFALLVSCSSRGAHLVVELRTDFVPAREFTSVEVDVMGPGGRATMSTPVYQTDDFVTGRHVLELPEQPTGAYTIATSLLDGARHRVAGRLAEVTLGADLALVVVISRDCRGVT